MGIETRAVSHTARMATDALVVAVAAVVGNAALHLLTAAALLRKRPRSSSCRRQSEGRFATQEVIAEPYRSELRKELPASVGLLDAATRPRICAEGQGQSIGMSGMLRGNKRTSQGIGSLRRRIAYVARNLAILRTCWLATGAIHPDKSTVILQPHGVHEVRCMSCGIRRSRVQVSETGASH